MKARYLVDKSALARMPLAPVRDRLGPIIEAGEAATCGNHEEHERIRQRRALAYSSVPITEAILARAIAVQGKLARSGRHRVPIPDLVIAASAEAAGLILLHYDQDFDRIAEVTHQPTEWVVERGSLQAGVPNL